MSLYASPLLSAFQRMASHAKNPADSQPQALSPANNSDDTIQAPVIPSNPNCINNDNIKTKQSPHVLTHTNRAVIAKWMIENADIEGESRITTRAVTKFPQWFRGSYKANVQRASRYWKQRTTLVNGHNRTSKNSDISFVKATKNGVKRHYCRAKAGRGRHVLPWVQALQNDMFDEFNRMRKAGVKFNARLLRRLALNLIASKTEGVYHKTLLDCRSNCLISDRISCRWIQSFMEKSHIVSRAQCGKLMVSPAKQEQIEREVAYHLGQLARDSQSKSLRDEDVYNADETHFCINMDNHKTLALIGDKGVRYTDVVSGDDGITMMVLISGGVNAGLEMPMLIFKNVDKNYPIRGLTDDVPGVVYRTGPKAWMDKRVFLEWVREKRVFRPLPNGRKRVLFIDKVNTHALTDEVRDALSQSNTEIRFFPCNATHLVQPADSFVIQKFKTYWRHEWDYFKMSMLQNGMWVDGPRASGKPNPGKRHFLKLAAKSTRAVSAMRDSEGVTYARKAMIRCGLLCNLNGQWEERQLFPSLQAIIGKYRENSNGEVVGSST